jgi:hypothetical protein
MMMRKVRHRSSPSFSRHESNSSPHRFSGPKVPTQDKGKGKAIEETEVVGNKGVLLILSFLARRHEANQGYWQRLKELELDNGKGVANEAITDKGVLSFFSA